MIKTVLMLPRPLKLLLLALGTMLFVALSELTIGWAWHLLILRAEGVHLLGHSLYLFFALLMQYFISKAPLPAKSQLWLECGGSLTFAIVLAFLAYNIAFNIDPHHHLAHTSGLVILLTGTLSLSAHTIVSIVLHNNTNPLIMGACFFAKSHVAIALSIIIGGALHLLFGWEAVEKTLSLMIACFMAFFVLKLVHFNVAKLLNPRGAAACKT